MSNEVIGTMIEICTGESGKVLSVVNMDSVILSSSKVGFLKIL